MTIDWVSVGIDVAMHSPMLVAGLFGGAFGYRYLLKKDPKALAALVAEVNTVATDAVKDVAVVVTKVEAANPPAGVVITPAPTATPPAA